VNKMAPFSFIALATLAAGAVAQNNQPPPVPLGAVIGQLSLPIVCQVNGTNQTFSVTASGQSPAIAKNGAQFYLTDAAASIIIPANVIAFARNAGASSASANTSLYINATNASPASKLGFSGTIPLSLPSTGATTLRIPSGNGTLSKIGPFVVGASKSPALTSLGNVAITLDLKDSTGKSINKPVYVTCGKQNINYGFTNVNVDIANVVNSSTYNPAPSNGYIPKFGSVSSGNEYGFFRVPYNCTLGPLGTQILDLTVGGSAPLYLAPSQKWSLTRGQSYLRIPASLLQLAKMGFPTVSDFRTNVTQTDILFSNSSPSSINVAKTPIISVVDVTNANTSQPLVIPIPASGDLASIGPITAGAAGLLTSLSVGNATAHTQLRNATGAVLFEFDVACTAVQGYVLAQIPITNQKPGNYSL